MELGELEIDGDKYARGATPRWTLCTEANDAPDDLAAVVRTALVGRGRLSTDNVLWADVSCGCWNRPDARTKGPRLLIAHYLGCPGFTDQINTFRSDPTRATWRHAMIAFAYKTGRVLPDWSATPTPLSLDLVEEFLAANVNRPIEVGRQGYTATPCGLTVDDVPAQTSRPVDLDGLLVAERRGEARVIDHRALGIRPTTAPRAAVRDWLASDDRDVANARIILDADATRFGARVVYAVRGGLPSAPPRDLAAEVEELRARLSALEGGRPVPPVPVGIEADRYDDLKM
jgi:hypothetical protein